MLRNYLATALRNIRQQPLYAFINICSLAIGIAACVVIYLFVTDEASFDCFHSKADRIYRLNETQNFTGTNFQKVALSGSPMGPFLQKDFPEVESYTRYWGRGKRVMQKDETKFLLDEVVAVDSTFLEIFGFEMLYGDLNTALDEPNTTVLTEETAAKFFQGSVKCTTQTISIGPREYKITDCKSGTPENSHLQFDALEAMATYIKEDPKLNTDWTSNFLTTYLLLKPHTDAKLLEAKFPEFMIRFTENKDIGERYTIYLQPLTEVHSQSIDVEHDYHNYRKFNGSYLSVFVIVGLFILLIASVNFMNLTTARASHRWKEIGVRKSVGARRTQLFGQFIFESMLLALMALAVAIVLDFAFIPMLNQAIGRQLQLVSLLAHPVELSLMVLIVFVLGLATGIYPSLYMASFSSASVLKVKAGGKSSFASSLVVIQFGLALAMIVSTLVVLQQLNFMKTTDTGFDKEQMLLVDLNRESNEKFEVLKTELSRIPQVLGVTASGQRLGNNFHQWGFKIKADTGLVELSPSNVNVEYDYLKVYGIKLKDGRGFSRDIPTDKGKAFILNESFVNEFKLKDPVGMTAGHGWYHNDSLGTIIGVVKDFNFNSMHHRINNLSLVCHPDWGYDEMSIKIEGTQAREAIAAIKDVWDSQVHSYPFTYTFLSQHFDNLYRSDEQMSYVVTIMAMLAILISCMGLFGLAVITTERRVKEIGIRKALGATEVQIVALLSSKFAKLIMIAFVLGSPVTYYLLSRWLESFAYRIGINPLIFLLGGLIALGIALQVSSVIRPSSRLGRIR